MSAGFEIAGIRSLWNLDRDPSDAKLSNAIAQIYEHNFNSPVRSSTLQEVAQAGFAGLERPDIQVLTQSCRNLSRSNLKATESDADTAVALSAARAIEHFLPLAIVAENVPQYAVSESWAIVKGTLEELGYSITSSVVNAANYGVPQDRLRLIVIAMLDAPAPTFPTEAAVKTGWYEAIADLLPHLDEIEPTPSQLKKVETLNASWLDKPLLIERIGSWKSPKARLADKPCWTIRKSIWLDQRHNSRATAINILMPDGTWRNLGVRGAARLCSIPDWFWLPETAWSAGSAIGNGVPCLLASAIARVIKPLLLTNPTIAPAPKAESPSFLIAGVDEVGRGCLFGPVVSCALVLNPSKVEDLIAAGVTDSKKISNPRFAIATGKPHQRSLSRLAHRHWEGSRD